MKRHSKTNYAKNYNRIIRILIKFGLFLPFLTRRQLPSADYQTARISIFMVYSSSPSATTPSAAPDPVHVLISFKSTTFDFFQIDNLSFTASPSLPCVKKRCQQSYAGPPLAVPPLAGYTAGCLAPPHLLPPVNPRQPLLVARGPSRRTLPPTVGAAPPTGPWPVGGRGGGWPRLPVYRFLPWRDPPMGSNLLVFPAA